MVLNDSYGTLRKFLRAKDTSGFGWVIKYNQKISSEMNYAYLQGHYQSLLMQVLDWVPPALQKEIMKSDTDDDDDDI